MLPTVKINSHIVSTESQLKVITAILKIFPDAKIENSSEIKDNTEIIADLDIKNLSSFTDLLEKQQILDSARKRARKGLEESNIENGNFVIKLRLNKQSAFVGKINFLDIEEVISPLSYFDIKIDNISDIESFLNTYFPEWKSRREEREKIEKRIKISQKVEEKSKQKLKKSNI